MMASTDNVRLTVTFSRETDLALRTHLGALGMRKGDLSKFIEEAVRGRMFDETVRSVRSKFADLPPDELQAMIDEACAAVRADMFPAARSGA